MVATTPKCSEKEKMNEAKRFDLLADIMRASHFEWRRAVLALCPDLSPVELVKQYWEEVGRDTAKYYLKKIDGTGSVAHQVASLVVSSSIAMGEKAEVLEGELRGSYHVLHTECPWHVWHKRENLLREDQVGCDHWLKTVVDEVNCALGTSLRFKTVESLPSGGNCCLRVFWEEGQ
jgi:hypothetical protein